MDSPGVLKEIDCYISGALKRKLLLILYKNRGFTRSLEHEQVKDGRMKCSPDLLELTIHDGKNPSMSPTPGQNNSYLLRSEVMKLPTSVLGYFVNDECHLIPLVRDALVMDTVKEVMKEKSRVPERQDHASTSEAPTTSTVVSARLKSNDPGNLRGQIGVRRRPADNDPDVLFRQQQHLAPWHPVRYKRFMPSDAFENRIPLLYPYEDNEQTARGTNGPRQDAYTTTLLSSLAPVPATHGRVEPVNPPTMEELLQSIMMKVHVIRFNKLVACVRERFSDPHSVTNATVLQHLQKVAVLIRGWWVVKSELLYPPTMYSEHAAVPSSLMIRARDYILAVFHRGEHLTRKTISSMTKLPALEATEILKLVARKMNATQKGHVNHWEFHPLDTDFVRKYPDVVQQQHLTWEARIRQLCGQLKLERLVSDGTRRRRRCSGRISSESESEAELEIRSLISGVHVSSGGRKTPTTSRRRRQLSLSQTSESGDKSESNISCQPARKRARTQSLSATSTVVSPIQMSQLQLPSGGIESRMPTPDPQNAVEFTFSVPTSPPVSKILSPPLTSPTTTPISKQSVLRKKTTPHRESPVTEAVSSVDPETSETACSSPPVCKPEPTSPCVRPVPEEVDGIASFVLSLKEEPMELNHVNDSLSNPPEHPAPDSRLVAFVQEKLSMVPIISLSALAKITQSANFLQELLADEEPLPPPGSEAERELLKPKIMEALSHTDARQLHVVWPTSADARPEEPLFATRVAGNECGAVSEDRRMLRDAIFDVFEQQSSFRMKDLQERLTELSLNGLPRNTICSMLKNLCVYKRSRYFLRPTVVD
ncbi:DNA-directed RNA polymerase III subunit RPC5 [Clonorchis sinensis]|uniref:DNA-directed RNA polymerase III subunit RPC5 n=1 Tax=Clonorchis sinensis TaxID=79923 RepID=A0A8T1M5H9_CLOSI|nr:DNA-directed RNA polymerase III subunit RPC5 [Clonorchis sinensis]